MDDDTNIVDDSETPDQAERTDARPAAARYDGTEPDQPSVMIVEAVAAATDRLTTELPPLQNTLDGDALDALLDGRPPSASVTVSFRYADTAVSVSDSGSMDVRVDGDPGEEANE